MSAFVSTHGRQHPIRVWRVPVGEGHVYVPARKREEALTAAKRRAADSAKEAEKLNIGSPQPVGESRADAFLNLFDSGQ